MVGDAVVGFYTTLVPLEVQLLSEAELLNVRRRGKGTSLNIEMDITLQAMKRKSFTLAILIS